MEPNGSKKKIEDGTKQLNSGKKVDKPDITSYMDQFGGVYCTRHNTRVVYNREYIKGLFIASVVMEVKAFADDYFFTCDWPRPSLTSIKEKSKGWTLEKKNIEDMTYTEAMENARKSKAKDWKQVLVKAENARIKIIGALAGIAEELTKKVEEEEATKAEHKALIEIDDHLRKSLGYASEIIENSEKINEESPFIKHLKEKGILRKDYKV